jgi:hypothetical protein
MCSIHQIVSSDFELWAAVIRSGQLPQEEVPSFLRAKPEFARWYYERYLSQGNEPPKRLIEKAA